MNDTSEFRTQHHNIVPDRSLDFNPPKKCATDERNLSTQLLIKRLTANNTSKSNLFCRIGDDLHDKAKPYLSVLLVPNICRIARTELAYNLECTFLQSTFDSILSAVPNSSEKANSGGSTESSNKNYEFQLLIHPSSTNLFR